MDCAKITTELVNCEKRLYSVPKKDYKLDLWRKLRKRWMILGVLVSMTLAVISPKVGAPGGPLRTEYLSYLPLCWLFYWGGRRARRVTVSTRTALLSVAHAHAVAPALMAAARVAPLDRRLLDGALLSCVGAPCAWLSLAAARDVGTALVLLAVNYVTSFIAAPIAMFLICGRAPLPSLGSAWRAALLALPLAAGAVHQRLRPRRAPSRSAAHVCSLALLYVDCCERAAMGGAGLYVQDVLGTLMLALWFFGGSWLVCAWYARRGAAPELAVCAVPKALHIGWELSIDCVPSGLARLPAVFMAPTQALLLAAIADYDDDEYEGLENGQLPH